LKFMCLGISFAEVQISYFLDLRIKTMGVWKFEGNKLHRSTNFIFFGPTDQKLWVFENLKRSMGMSSMCYSQPASVDYISPKWWVVGIRNFEKSPLRVSSPIFWTLSLHLEECNLTFLMELGDFIFFQFFLLKLEDTWTFVSAIGIFV
jgi:hypothetical protein